MVRVLAGARVCSISKVTGDGWSAVDDVLAIEEPLEIRIVQSIDGDEHEFPLSITMRTPGEDVDLAIGFLLSEGLVDSIDQIQRVQPCHRQAVVRVHLSAHVKIDPGRLQRHFYTSSSCGVCGKASIDAVTQQIPHKLLPLPNRVRADTLHGLPRRLRQAQQVFEQTGGLHASGLFSLDGELIRLREDVGRHNALDKLIGAQSLADATQFDESILIVSGRVSFELVQKALMAGIPILVAVGAPSSLANELAQHHAMTLVGFLRDERFNVYCGAERIEQHIEQCIEQ